MSEIRAQPGPQTAFLSTRADIALYGGGAGAGKTVGLLLEALRHVSNPRFSAVIFRRSRPQITAEGGLWDTSREFYLAVGGVPFVGPLEWRFPSGATIRFAHLQHDKDVDQWHGSQIVLLCWDESCHFSKHMFFGLLGRNRSTCGVKPYVRMTCNPDNSHWLREFIGWWIGPDGLPIKERSGVVRWLTHFGGVIEWHASQVPDSKSFTYIPALLSDNKILTDKDPGYLTNLKNLSALDRARLLDGNWDAKPAAGVYWRRYNIDTIEAMPATVARRVRAWDLASVAPHAGNPDPDWTVGLLLAELVTLAGKRWVIEDLVRLRGSPLQVTQTITNTAQTDGPAVQVVLEEQPGAAGVFAGQALVAQLAGFTVKQVRPTGDKLTRFGPVSAQAEAGNVSVLRAPWNGALHSELEALGGGKEHDDIADSLSLAFSQLSTPVVVPRVRSL